MTSQTTIRDIAVAIPSSVRVFEKYGIDFCCNGKRPLQEACDAQGLAPAKVLDEINEAAKAEPAPDRNWSRSPLGELVDYIVGRHHTYLESELPVITARLEKVVSKHGGNYGWLRELQSVFTALSAELQDHLRKEEIILFPYIKKLDAGAGPVSAPFGTVANPIRMMFMEHDNAGAALAEMRRLSNGYTAPEDGCTTFHALMHELSRLEEDLHQHIHLENNILFPRAVEVERSPR